jgi:hypothetical protein
LAENVVIDACCLLNLFATRHEREILEALDWVTLTTPQARGEALYLSSPPDADGVRLRAPVDWSLLQGTNRLEIRPLGDTATDLFVQCAEHLPDGDASCVALAATLAVPLVTDDGKERRIARSVAEHVRQVSTLEFLHAAARLLKWDRGCLRQVVLDLRWCGNFLPPRKDRHAQWYGNLLDE